MHAFNGFKGGQVGPSERSLSATTDKRLTLSFFWQYHEYHLRIPSIRAGAGHDSWTSVVWLDFFLFMRLGWVWPAAAVGASRLLRT